MNKPTKISIVTVCYNAVNKIEDTMLSVLNQTYPNVEYIIIDGGSTDGTVDIIKKYADRLAYWVSEPDKGIYDAMNKGIAVATGDYINFMNAGDTFNENNTISCLLDLFPINTDVVYGDTIHKTLWGEYLNKVLPLNTITWRMPFGHQSSFVNTILMKENGFDTSYKSSGDYHFLYNCYMKKKSFSYVPLTISKYDLTQGMSMDNYRIKYYEDARIWGIENSMKWKIGYEVRVAILDLRNFVKKIIPKQLLSYYKKFRIRRFENKN